MRKIILIALLGYITQMNAQLITFNRQIIYPSENEVAIEYNALQQTTDKGYITCRAVTDTISSNNYSYCEIIKTDSAGNLSWTKRILIGMLTDSMTQVGLTIIQSNDKGYMVGASIYKTNKLAQIALVKTDGLGNVVWAKEYTGEGASTAYSIKQTTDKGYIVCGSTINPTNKQYAYIFKTDSSGNYTWGKKCLLGTDTIGSFYSVLELPGQGYVVGGFSNTRAFIAKFDLNGNLLWDKDVFKKGAVFNSVIKTSDNAILLGGSYNDTVSFQPRLCFAKFDTLGNMLWLKGYNQTPNPYYGSYAWSVKEMPNYFVFAGYISDPIPATLIGKLDLNGNFIWCNEYRYTFHTFNYTPNTITTTTDGGFALATMVGIIGAANFSTELLKVDSLGNLGCDGASHSITLAILTYSAISNAVVSASGSVVSYTPTLSNSTVIDTVYCETPSYLSIEAFSAKQSTFQVYPNPNNGSFVIEPSSSMQQNMQLFDVNGKLVLSQTINGKINIDASNLNEGVYNISLQSTEGIVNKRLVIVR